MPVEIPVPAREPVAQVRFPDSDFRSRDAGTNGAPPWRDQVRVVFQFHDRCGRACGTVWSVVLTMYRLALEALRMTARDLRAGELRLLAAALLLAGAAHTRGGFFVDWVRLGLQRSARHLL